MHSSCFSTMFGCLFESEEEVSVPEEEKKGKEQKHGVNSKLEKSPPPLPRGATGLCGLQNQGATCYLNSLLQTLFFTPEFRNGLFRLGTDDLVDLSSGRANFKVQAIPLQLKKLFAQLLLLDKDSIKTDDLTCSFGWTGNEGFQQHDVQELNRVLFSAIESSLVGTSRGVDFIRTLYHGTSVTKVVCQECGKASEREEDYLDLPLTLSGCSGLEQSLSMSYVAIEILEGANQYKCETCVKHVNALKSSKIRRLPPILTFSLLRFDYDIHRGERFKETKRYSFPTSLSMKEFCEFKAEEQELDQEYDLYSVVIHSGSCYGGHYHAYICDLEGLATWTPPEDEHVRVVQKDNDGHEDVIHCNNPVDLMVALLKKMGGSGTVNQLCQCLSKETGHSWNKRFRSRHGSLTKFFKKNSDVFKFSDISGCVSLQTTTKHGDHPERSGAQKNNQPARCQNKEDICFVEEESSRKKCQWFDINDSRISCIRDEDLQCQFSGKESAYMLFYRRRNLSVPKENPAFSVPAGLKTEVEEMNKELARNREEYDRLLNEISVCVHFGDDYTVKNGALELKQGLSTDSMIVALDRRKTTKDLIEASRKLHSTRGGDLSNQTLHIARHLAAGLHLFDEISIPSENSLLKCGIQEGTEVFFWNGKEVDGCNVYPGESSAPVLLYITYPLSPNEDPVEIQKAFTKNTTIGEMKLIVANLTGIPHQELLLTWMTPKGKSIKFVPLTSYQDGSTLKELHFKDGDNLVAEKNVGMRARGDDVPSLATEGSEKHGNLLSFVVENRYLKSDPESPDDNERNPSWSVFPVKVLNNQSIGELKARVLSESGIQHIADFCRLRLDDDAQGLGPPLYEHDAVSSSSLKHGDKLVLESGSPLKPGQLMLRYYVRSASHSRQEMEVVVDKTITVQQCLRLLTERANLEGMQWHLRKTDWFGEPKDALNNEDETLEGENIKHGDTLIIEKGKLLAKGFICISLWQASNEEAREQNPSGVFTRIATSIQGLLAPTSTETSEDKNEMCSTASILCDLEISLDASLYDLKLQICALPQLADHVIPTPGFVRLQEITDGRLMRVLRGLNQTLRQLKLTSSSQIAVQILQDEENLSPSAVLLKLKRRTPGERAYDTVKEVIFDPTDGATPSSLLRFIARVYDISLDHLVAAKYFRDKYEWLVIKDTPNTQVSKHKGGKRKCNLRQPPYNLQDGDILGVKDYQDDPENQDDFSTPADDEGKKRLQREEKEKKQRKKDERTRRAETPLIIHVHDR